MKKILITPLDGMGDTLMTTPAIQLLKENIPDCEITCFVYNKSTHDILLNNPYIDKLWYYPLKTINFIKGTYHILRYFTFRYDFCINFYPSNRSAYNIFALMVCAKYRLGHRYLHKDFSQLNWLKNKTLKEDYFTHCVVENVKLLSFFNLNIAMDKIPAMKLYHTKSEIESGLSYRKSINKFSRIVGIHAGTSTFKGHANRRWPKERFVELIDTFPDICFLLFGGGDDEVVINKYISSSVKNRGHVFMVEEKGIREVASIIGTLDAFISNDSGLMHVAAAMNIPLVVLLGPTNEHFIYPWAVKYIIASLRLPCSPCFYYSPDHLRCSMNNSFKCLRSLDSGIVADALRKVLEKV